MSELTNLQARYDGPIPQDELDRIKYGSLLARDISETEKSIKFYRDMLVKSRQSSREWFRRGNLNMAESCRRDGWAYLKGWRVWRKRLTELKPNNTHLKTLVGIGKMLFGDLK